MMQLLTPVEISRSDRKISHDQELLLLGSCFSDSIGSKLLEYGFRATLNPFGTLYNPMSIAQTLLLLLSDANDIDRSMIVCHDNIWHSFLHHSRFSDSDSERFCKGIRQSIACGRENLQKADILIITFGTSYVFYKDGQVVSNCHKLPATMFERKRLTVEHITACWQELLRQPALKDKRIIFTVSPIRHKADGMHGNQLSKATLLLAVEQLQTLGCEYFPSYELLLDEMRDYRFYAEDMLHPNEQAVKYIWERFGDTYFSDTTKQKAMVAHKEYLRNHHRDIIL